MKLTGKCFAGLFAAMAVATFTPHAAAQFKVPGLGGGSSAEQVDPAKVSAMVNESVAALMRAQSNYAAALGNQEQSAKALDIAKKFQSGTAGAADLATAKEMSDSTAKSVKEAMDKGVKLSADSQAKASAGMVDHVDGSVKGAGAAKQLKSAMQSRNPATLSSLASLKDFPVLLSSWGKASGTVMSYLSTNGLDTKDAEAKLMGAFADI